MPTPSDRRVHSLSILYGLLPLAWALGSCQAPQHCAGAAEDSAASEDEDEGEDEDHALHRAELALERARLGSEATIVDARTEVRDAEHALEDARIELASFLGHEYPMELAEQTLALEETKNELESARADLAGILQIYAEEQEARSKDEIIRRNRDAVRFAEEQLRIEARRAHLALDESLPRRERELRRALRTAEEELGQARRALERAERECRIDVEEAALDLLEERAKQDKADDRDDRDHRDGRDDGRGDHHSHDKDDEHDQHEGGAGPLR